MLRTLALILAMAACSNRADAPAPSTSQPPPAQPAAPGPVAKDPAAARTLIAAGAIVLDVRTPEEFGDGHLAAASNMPVQQFHDHLADIARLTGGDKTKPIAVYCAGGRRAAKAKEQLEAAGYTQVVNGGGYDDLR